MNQAKKTRFTLRRNQNGQVGIFVALIFQVIFVFFAMLVNVGLVVHHKINLQQSTDLAAYYGAMKQAEILNVMAHVNYQMRQAWKLMTWRYRVLGTFGMERKTTAPTIPIQFPIKWDNSDRKPMYNSDSRDFTCRGAGANAENLTITDVPAMCMGHSGFGDWISAASGEGADETFCKIDCSTVNSNNAFTIDKLPDIASVSLHGNDLSGPIRDAIGRANATLRDVCVRLGPITTQMLALYYGHFTKDIQNRKALMFILNKNLGLPKDKMLDIEGKSVLQGVQATLKNNLTQANLESLTNTSIDVLNGAEGVTDRMLQPISFDRLMFFVVDCLYNSSGSNVSLKSIDENLDPNIINNLREIISDPAAIDQIQSIFRRNISDFNTIGYEKNPWYQVYYGVKATSEPKIPFLPLAKIKLHAISFAKPFGGTIGPWYFKDWKPDEEDSSTRNDFENRTDRNLPIRYLSGSLGNTLKEVRDYMFNYSTHVGDTFSNGFNLGSDVDERKGGLANTDIVALYHGMLANKYGEVEVDGSRSKTKETNTGFFRKPVRWPKYQEWYHLAKNPDEDDYDPLALDRQDGEPKNSYMRDIELTVVAPNQFDLTYYSIEPDFYKNYRDKLKDDVILRLKDNAQVTGETPRFPFDFGNPGKIEIDGIPKEFSVRHQIKVVKEIFKENEGAIIGINGSTLGARTFTFNFLASTQASVLTGWTFKNLLDFSSFPNNYSDEDRFTMQFGYCHDDNQLNPGVKDFNSLADTNGLPAAPGNCVTGGRTGYSVKLISSELVKPGMRFKDLGGPSSGEGEIRNPAPASFFNFSY